MPEIPQSQQPLQPEPTPATAASPRRRGTILVVDPGALSLIALAGVLDSQGYTCLCARTPSAARQGSTSETIDLVVCDVGDDAPAALELLASIREQPQTHDLPAVLIADQRWAGLQQKTEAMVATTRCLFKPIDPGALLAVVEPLLWMPQVIASHRRRGTRPGRPGWVSL